VICYHFPPPRLASRKRTFFLTMSSRQVSHRSLGLSLFATRFQDHESASFCLACFPFLNLLVCWFPPSRLLLPYSLLLCSTCLPSLPLSLSPLFQISSASSYVPPLVHIFLAFNPSVPPLFTPAFSLFLSSFHFSSCLPSSTISPSPEFARRKEAGKRTYQQDRI
jgi:hypothetical protein